MNEWSRTDQELWVFEAFLCELETTGDFGQEWGDLSSLSGEEGLLTI